jgi:hypothetical protein
MRELDFINYLEDKWVGMAELRKKAVEELAKKGVVIVPRQIEAVQIGVDFHLGLVAQQQIQSDDSSWSRPFPFPFTHGVKKTRREELEEMTDSDIRNLHVDIRLKEIREKRIEYILESEKEYK